MKRRCEIMVRTRQYGEPGQCEKTKGLRVIKIADTPVTVCKIHANVLGAGKELVVTEKAR